jgi:hypothetical protein
MGRTLTGEFDSTRNDPLRWAMKLGAMLSAGFVLMVLAAAGSASAARPRSPATACPAKVRNIAQQMNIFEGMTLEQTSEPAASYKWRPFRDQLTRIAVLFRHVPPNDFGRECRTRVFTFLDSARFDYLNAVIVGIMCAPGCSAHDFGRIVKAWTKGNALVDRAGRNLT